MRKNLYSLVSNRLFHISLLLLSVVVLVACALGSDNTSAQPNNTQIAETTPTATPTSPPPPPQVAFTPVPPDTVSPIIVQRYPRPGEEFPTDSYINLVFDRAMNQDATGNAFSLQLAADSPQQIDGNISWPDERTLRFTPANPLDWVSVYDTILTQDAIAADGAPLAEPFTFRFSTPGYLEVAQVIPANGTVDVETKPTITVMFNRPVVPLTSLAEAENFPQPVKFDPDIKGSGEWLNTSIYIFTPDEDLPGGITFNARVEAGLTDVTGKTILPEDFAWTFATQPPEVVFTDPTDGQTLVPIESVIQITFSQPVDPESAQNNFELAATGLLGREVDGEFLVQDNLLVFTPTTSLDFDTTYQVNLNAGITSAAGGKGMRDSYSFQFTTVPLPKITHTEPADGDRDVWPHTQFTIFFNTPINPATVMDHVTMKPPLPITPTHVYTYYNQWDNSFNFSFDSKPSTDYEVRITPGIEDPYGNKTKEDLTVRFRTARVDPNYQLRTPDTVGTYDSALPANVVFSAINVNRIDLKLYQLDPQEIVSPIWQWNDYQPTPDDLIREWSERLEAPDNEITYHVVNLSEDDSPLEPGLYFLETDSPDIPSRDYYYRPRHVLVVTKANLTLKSGQRDTLVWATDLANGEPMAGLEVDFYNEEARPLGTAITDNDGVARLELSQEPYRNNILAVVNQPLFSAVSENWARGVSPYEFGLDLTYQLPDYNVHIYTDRPIYRPDQTVYYKGIVRTEDDVEYRLPDLGQVHVTVRDAAYEIIQDETLVLSPSGTFNGEVELAAGAALGPYYITVDFDDQYFEKSFQVAAYRPPEFEVTVTPSADEILRGDDFEAMINVDYFFGGPLAGTDVTWNLLAEDYRFEPAQLSSYTFTDNDDPYACFDCWWWYQEPFPTPILSGNGTTDANGQLLVQFDGEEIDQLLETGSHRLTIEATATGPDNQFISGRESLVQHKGDYYIGLSPQEYVADAGKETAIDLVAVDWDVERQSDKELDVQVIRREWVNTFVENETGGGYWTTETKEELVDQFTVTTNELGEAVATFTPPQGGSYQIVAQDAATLLDPETNSDKPVDNLARSNIRSSIFIWVAGEDDVSWRRENHDRITLISDKTTYEPGETAEILIPSPFTGEHEALVTIERGRIKQHEVIKMTGSSEVYRLPITTDFAPNIYVSVVLVQGRESQQDDDSPRVAAYKVGILPIDVTPSAQELTISLTPSVEQAEPGKDVTYNLEVTNVTGQPVSAEFSLDLVDKAILTLQPRQANAILDAYYGRRGLGINTASGLAVSANRYLLELAEDLDLTEEQFAAQSESRSLGDEGIVLEKEMAVEEEAMDMAAEAAPLAPTMMADGIGGGGPDNAQKKAEIPQGVEVREDFSDTAFWNPVVLTDERGQAQVTVSLPDNLTTWVMRGVGVTNDTLVGEETVELLSTKPLLIRPVAPRFFVVDDRAQLAANVSNNTDDDLEVEVTLAANGIVINDETPAVQTVNIPARSESKVTWDVTVEDNPAAELAFAAVSTDGEYSDASKPRLTTGPDGSLLVFRYTAPDIVGTAGQLPTGGSSTEVVALPPNYDDQRGMLSIQLDPSLAAGMRDGLKYLKHYPYECTEQTVSRFLPNILTWDAMQSLGIENEELEAELPGLIEEGLDKLYTQQNPDGGWGWWAGNESNVYITSYVVFALTKADQAGVDVSATALANGQNFLLNHLQSTRDLNSTFDANRHAYVLYVLAEGGRAPRDSLDALVDVREKLSHYGRAYLAMALDLTNAQQYSDEITTLLSDINNAAILSATGAHWEEERYDFWAMNTDTRSTAIILDALARLDPENPLNPNVVRWLMVARQDGIWETTQETAWALIALTDWMQVTGELEADYDYSAILNDEELFSGTATTDNVGESTKLQVDIADLLADTSNLLTVARTDGNGRLYYSAHLKVFLPVEEIEPTDRGIIVSRRYTLESCLAEQADDDSVVCNEVREAKLGDVIRVDLTIIAPNDLYYVVVEDPLPAGGEAIDTGLATTSLLAMDPTLSRQDSPYWWWWRWYSRSELRDEKVVLFADYLPKGTYEYSYTMRTTLPGDYHVIPTVATQFYFPEVFGRSDGRLLSIGQ